MLPANLPEPVLSLALPALGNIQQSDELAIGSLWAVLTKVRGAVIDGQRLENISWRLWHRARIAPNILTTKAFPSPLPRFPEVLPCPLASPSLSFSSSSEGTSTSSEWDRDTAVGEDDDLQVVHSPGARRITAVYPLPEKPQLDLALGSNPTSARASPSSASTCKCHQHNPSQGLSPDCLRQLPSASPHSTPHHRRPSKLNDAGDDAYCLRPKNVCLSDSHHQSSNPASATAGLEVSSLSSSHDSRSQHTFSARDTTLFPSSNAVPRAGHSAPDTSRFATEVLPATTTASSMPITLPAPRKKVLTVGGLIAQLFSENNVVETSRDPGRHEEGLTSGQSKDMSNSRALIMPKIVEPQPSVMSPSQPGTSPSAAPNSTLTSAASTPRQTFPTVVVVNPTPHPTPPATPSPGISDTPFDLNSTATPIGRFDKHSGWDGSSGSVNGQLATPVSINGDAMSAGPTFAVVHPSLDVQFSRADSHEVSSPAVLPAAAIALPERPADFEPSLHLPTPAAEPSHNLHASELINSSKTTPAPIPAAPTSEDKKFFLAAPHSGSGGSGPDSSESPDSLGAGSLSPDKRDMLHAGPLLGARDVALHGRMLLGRHEHPVHEEEVASSFSASSPAGRAPSVTSSKGGSSKVKGRSAFAVAGGSRRRPVSKVVLAVKENVKKTAEAKVAEEIRGTSVEREERSVKGKSKGKGKEREQGERRERRDDVAAASEASTAHPLPTVKSLQQLPSHRAHVQPPQHLRHLPTNPPRRQPSPTRRPSPDTQPSMNEVAAPDTRRLPYHPQLGHLGLGHLPTVPPKQRRPIEITETSSEYETTDTEGDESSWESESCSGDEADQGKHGRQAIASKPVRESSSMDGKTSAAPPNSNSRTRDAREFVRDAALEAQRQRDLFQKLPPRTYSSQAQLPRTKSGLSLLFRPDPELFPEGHPYRTSRSSHDILARNWSSSAIPSAMTALSKRATPIVSLSAAVNADPVIASVNSRTSTTASTGAGLSGAAQRNGYRPRAKPADQEEETDSGEEDPEDTIQVSSSVAERRLAALMGPRGTRPPKQPPSPSRAASHPVSSTQNPGPQPVTRTTTAPVLMHPYLPDPAPLQTPHTVRRNIISQELDEELRRNLLWERSQNQIQGRPARAPGSILPGPWLPLTSMNSGENVDTQTNASDKAPGKRPFATQRTKSWAGDYHACGW